MAKHKNSNNAIGNFCIYQILFEGKVYKVGKADFDRITKFSGIPTRIHQQIRILSEKHETKTVTHVILETLLGVSTLDAKRMEKKLLRLTYKINNEIPEGNKKSFKP